MFFLAPRPFSGILMRTILSVGLRLQDFTCVEQPHALFPACWPPQALQLCLRCSFCHGMTLVRFSRIYRDVLSEPPFTYEHPVVQGAGFDLTHTSFMCYKHKSVIWCSHEWRKQPASEGQLPPNPPHVDVHTPLQKLYGTSHDK